MSTPSQDTPTNAVDIVLAGPERAAALRTLSAALAQLGDDASRAAQSSPDVRLHVVACQAQHLAGDVWALLPVDGGTDDPLTAGCWPGLVRHRGAASARGARRAPPAGWLWRRPWAGCSSSPRQ